MDKVPGPPQTDLDTWHAKYLNERKAKDFLKSHMAQREAEKIELLAAVRNCVTEVELFNKG